MIKGQKKWLVTGAAGFIGFHLVDYLLKANQIVLGVDNLITGKRSRLNHLAEINSPAALNNFEFVEGDLQDAKLCAELCEGKDYVLHQAALGSVPRSIEDPVATHNNNVNVFLNMLMAVKDKGVPRLVYASSSSVYGDNPTMPKKEENIGLALSPYALSKQTNELYAHVFQKNYGVESIGLRYFNVFGPAQDPMGAYAAVIPLWIRALLKGEQVTIFGDGSYSRDFCFVSNIVNANILSAIAPASATDSVYNIACGEQTTLNQLFSILREECAKISGQDIGREAVHRAPRNGDIPHSLANIERATRQLGFKPTIHVREGLNRTVKWYAQNKFLFDS